MAAKKKATKKAARKIVKRQKPQTELVKAEKFIVKEFHKHHILGIIVAALLAITALLLLITYMSNNT